MDRQSQLAAIIDWLSTEFETEQRAGFAILRRIPDTQVVRFLDHFDNLDAAGQFELKSILFDWSSFSFVGGSGINPFWQRFSEVTAFPERRGGRRYTGVKLLAGLAKDPHHQDLDEYFRTKGVLGLALDPPLGLIGIDAELTPIGIPALRHKVNAAFSRFFAQTSKGIGSEFIRYEGSLDGCQITVDIQYSGKMASPQLAYNAKVRGKGRQVVFPNLCFESVLGVGFGRWDYLTLDNADRSVELLMELVRRLAQLPERLPPGCCEMPDAR